MSAASATLLHSARNRVFVNSPLLSLGVSVIVFVFEAVTLIKALATTFVYAALPFLKVHHRPTVQNVIRDTS